MEAPLDHNQAPLVSLTVTTQQDLILIEARHPSRVYQGANAQADGVSDPTTPPPRPGSRTEKPGDVFILCVHRRSRRRRSSPSPPSSRPSGLRGTRQRCGASGSPSTFTCSAPILLVVHAMPAVISSHELLGWTPGRRHPPGSCPQQARHPPLLPRAAAGSELRNTSRSKGFLLSGCQRCCRARVHAMHRWSSISLTPSSSRPQPPSPSRRRRRRRPMQLDAVIYKRVQALRPAVAVEQAMPKPRRRRRL